MQSIHSTSNSSLLRIIKNSISLLSEGIIGKLSYFLFILVVVRHLSTADFGLYSTILSFVAIGGLLAEFGLSQVLVREIAQEKTKSAALFSGAL